MTKKADLLAAMEDDLKQFWTAFKGGLRSVPGTIVHGVGRLAGVTPDSASSVSYTHLTLPTNREV